MPGFVVYLKWFAFKIYFKGKHTSYFCNTGNSKSEASYTNKHTCNEQLCIYNFNFFLSVECAVFVYKELRNTTIVINDLVEEGVGDFCIKDASTILCIVTFYARDACL